MSNDFDKFYEVNGISINDNIGIFEGAFDPSDAGQTAPSGSLFLRSDQIGVWQKYAVNNDDWLRVDYKPYLPIAADFQPLVGESYGISAVSNVVKAILPLSPIAGDFINFVISDSTNNVWFVTTDGSTVNGQSSTPASPTIGKINISNKYIRVVFRDNNWTLFEFNVNSITDDDFNTLSSNVDTLSSTITSGVPLGSITNHTDVDTITNVPIIGDTLRFDGTNWVPSNSPTLSSITSNNAVFSIDTDIQTISSVNSFQPISFNYDVILEGWTHAPSASVFAADLGGAFMCTFEFNIEKTGGGNIEVAIIGRLNGTEIEGSHNGIDLTSNNTAFSVSRTFIFQAAQNDNLEFFIAANVANKVKLLPPPTPGGVTTPTGATLMIRRIT
jgi:hypothetical protein